MFIGQTTSRFMIVGVYRVTLLPLRLPRALSYNVHQIAEEIGYEHIAVRKVKPHRSLATASDHAESLVIFVNVAANKHAALRSCMQLCQMQKVS